MIWLPGGLLSIPDRCGAAHVARGLGRARGSGQGGSAP